VRGVFARRGQSVPRRAWECPRQNGSARALLTPLCYLARSDLYIINILADVHKTRTMALGILPKIVNFNQSCLDLYITLCYIIIQQSIVHI
jgi:hypothetical protein